MKREIDTSCAIQRRSVPALDSILGHAFPVLDKGFIRVIDYMGDDDAVIEMARVSYGAGTEAARDTAGLLRYLMRHHHTSPFEGCEIKLHVKLPVFVARQWIRHRTANVNEYSARYSILDSEFYFPEPEVMMKQSKTNKQGRAEVIDPDHAKTVLAILKQDARRSYDHYECMIENDENDPQNTIGLARELARINLPVNIYTQWYWKVDLHNLLHFLRLRADSHAQYEIRVYADEILRILGIWLPLTAAAADNYIFGSKTFSRDEMEVLRDYMRAYISEEEYSMPANRLRDNGASKGEIAEFIAKIKG